MNCANHFDRENTAFCQNCGKPLCQECTRKIGDAIYCEPCLAAKLAGVGAATAPGAYRYNDPASGINVSGSQSAGGTYTYNDPASGVYASGVIPPQPPHGAPSPLLAGALGLIPGVGAMYNEQYAKAGVHLVIFVILVSLANSNGLFGLFVAGWVVYMAFEAYHTARCRRDGLPLPNPFGLNDLGHKLGLEKAPHTSAPVAPPLDPYAAPYGTVPPAAAAPVYPPAYGQPYRPPSTPPPSWGVPPAQGWEQYNPAVPPMPPGTVPPGSVPLDANVPYPGNRFPAGAIWLIGLGALFLIFNAGFLSGISGRVFLPILLWGVAIFIFIRKMTDYGYGFINDGTPGYSIRIFRALRSSVWVALTGLLFFLDEFTPLKWSHSWPLYIILAGVMTVLQRVVYSGAAVSAQPPYTPGYGYPAPPPAAPFAQAPFTPAPFTPTPVAPAPVAPASTHDGFANDRFPNDKEGS